MAIDDKQHIEKVSYSGLLSPDPGKVNDAIKLLYNQYFAGVSSYLSKYGLGKADIQDVFHDGILTFLDALRKGKVKENANIGGYFFTICKHIGLKKGKLQNRIPISDIDFERLDQPPSDWANEGKEDERDKLRTTSWQLMEKLGKPCVDLLKMSFQSNRKIVAFYEELGYKNAQVARTAKYKCLKRLKEKIKKDPASNRLLKTFFS
ncbi:MAG: RNA polymerase sigma factor [Bacteroidia bacterium]